MANNQKMRIITFLLILLSFGVTAQITVNTNFLPNIAAPLDVRQKIATLADTTTVTFPYIGALCYVTSKDSVYYKGTNGWKPIGKRGNYVGTVTNFSAGDLSPLFTTSEATTTTTPALTFSQVSQTQNKVFASPDGSSGNPTFRAIAVNDVPTLNQNTTGSAATLTTGRTIAITGDLSYTSPSFDGSGNVTAAGTLATVNSNVGTFTNATITTNAKGLITAASSGAAVTGESTTVSDSPTVDLTLTGYDISAKVDTSKIATQYDLTLISFGDSTIVTNGTGISVSESPLNTFTVTNTAPDQTVSITGAGITNITGTYPNFTATSTEVDGNTTNEKITALTWNNSQDSLQVVENGVIYRTKIDGFLASEVDGSIINEGSLSVGVGGANSSSIQSNTLGSNTVTVSGGVGIGVSEVSNTITITNTVADSTVVSAGWGITVTESPANQYSVKADTSKLATQYDLVGLGGITGVYPRIPFFRTSSTFGNSDSLRWDTLNGALIVRDIPIGSNASGQLYAGSGAGSGATSAFNSNFLGADSGSSAEFAANSNFFGPSAGNGAINASGSNFFGNYAGYGATGANYSNIFGEYAGYDATGAYYSNFFGASAGNGATSASSSNFFGYESGVAATSASSSNFFGTQSGIEATNASNSNFFGFAAGAYATDAGSSNFFGENAGNGATDAAGSNFFGYYAGNAAIYASGSNFFGSSAGDGATSASGSNFFGTNAGGGATGAQTSNFFSQNAGYNATSASNSNFFGESAGNGATYSSSSNFFGTSSGINATNASSANFFGNSAGANATYAAGSNFFGNNAGNSATNADVSNFFGQNAGQSATNAEYSNFLGSTAGQGATDAANSNFFGNEAGYTASNASYCNLFGYRAGKRFTANNIGANNIIIGTNISLPDTFSSRINIGGVLFGMNTQSDLSGNPKTSTATGGKIGIMTVVPDQELHVTGNTRITGAIYDSNNDPGTSGQVLSSTVTGTDWVTSSGGSTDLSISGSSSPLTLNSSTGTDVTLTAGTGITLAGTSGNATITNSSPDQTVVITGSTGTYPNFTLPDASLTNEGFLGVAAGGANNSLLRGYNSAGTTTGNGTTIAGGTGITISESTSTNGGTITIDNTGMTSLNGLSGTSQTFAVGTASTDFNVASTGFTHTFNLPDASGSSRGALTSTDWTTFNNKFSLPALTSGSVLFSNGSTITQDNSNFFWNNTNKRLGIRVAAPAHSLDVMGSSTSTEFIGSFKANGVTLEAPTTGTKGNMLSLQGAGAAYYHGRDVTNDIDFLMGTSASGMVFMGSMSNHAVDIRTNNTARIAIASGGAVTIGNLSSGGSRNVVCDASGTLSTAALTSGTVTSVQLNAGSGISLSGTNPITTSGIITVTAQDPSLSNEGSLTVGAGGSTTSIINSNTSGSTGVTITAGTGLTISETGSSITLSGINAYGSLVQTSSSLTLTTTLSKLINLSSDISSTGITLDAGNDRMTVSNDGVYEVNFSCDCKGSGSTFDIEHMGTKNGSGASIIGLNTRITATNGVFNNMSTTKMISLTGGDYIEVWSKGSSTGGNVECINVAFTIKRIY